MSFSLESIGIEAGGRYESIYTTMNKEGEINAAPIGVKCFGDYDIGARIFNGSKTLENIIETKIFVINITDDPLLYTQATMGNLPEEYFVRDDDIAYIKNIGAYVIALVKSIEEVKVNDNIDNNSSFIIKAEPLKIVINKQGTKAMNRGLYAFLESLVDYTRTDLIDNAMKEEYIKRFKKNETMVKKVATYDVKKAMDIVKENMIKKGLDI